MANFKIVTDTGADLPRDYVKLHDIGMLSLSYMFGEEEYNWDRPMDEKEFFDSMRDGQLPTTSQVNIQAATDLFEELIKTYDEILVIGFSSGLSGSYNSEMIAANEVMWAHPEKQIRVIDSLCASVGQGLLVDYAVDLQKQGLSMEEVAEKCEEKKTCIAHVFTVDDLFHLFRGGRISRATAIVGSLAGIKPTLIVDEEGKLVTVGKVRGRKRALLELVNLMGDKMGNTESPKFFMSHGDCLEDAQFVANSVKDAFGITDHMINFVGPTIGSHTGPGLVAIVFFAEHR